MPLYPSLTQIARLSAMGMFSGPQASASSAQAIVSRLRRGQEWASRRLPSLITRFAEFSSSDVQESLHVDLPIIERRSAMIQWADFADEWGARARSLPSAATLCTALGMLAKHSLSVSGPSGAAAYLVAPNVLEAGVRAKFDLGDWAKWVSLRARVDTWLSMRTPFYREYCRELVAAAPIDAIDAEELARQLLLRECIIDVFMDSLTPKDLSSVNWITTHRPADFMVDGALISLLGGVAPAGIAQLRREMANEVHQILTGPGLESILNNRMWPSFQ